METLSPCRDLTDLLKIALFANLPHTALQALLHTARKRSYKKGAVVITEGDAAQALFIVCSGALKACLSDDQGRELVLSTIGAGEHFGELALLDGEPRSVNVAAIQSSELWVITKEAFHDVLQAYPECLWHVIHHLVQQVRNLTESVRTLALVDVFGRLVRLLSSLAVLRDDGIQVISPRPTQQDIANRIGSSREMVSRILKDLCAGGYLVLEPECIEVHRKFPARW